LPSDKGAEADVFAAALILLGTLLTFFGLKLFRPTLFVVAFIGSYVLAFQLLADHISADWHL
jgi:hypothetical protein